MYFYLFSSTLLSVSQTVYLFVCLSVYLSVCLSVYLYVCVCLRKKTEKLPNRNLYRPNLEWIRDVVNFRSG